MATLESAARIIHRPETPSATAVPAKTASREPETESRTDLFTQDELFGVKKDQYIKKARASIRCQLLCPVRVNYLGRFFPSQP